MHVGTIVDRRYGSVPGAVATGCSVQPELRGWTRSLPLPVLTFSKQTERAHQVIGKAQLRGERVGAEVAVGGAKHVQKVTSAGAECFSHAQVVFKDLA